MRTNYQRPLLARLVERLNEVPTRLQILAGPRQVGKTTLVRQLLGQRPAPAGMYAAADMPGEPKPLSIVDDAVAVAHPTSIGTADTRWLLDCWRAAERDAARWRALPHGLASSMPYVLVIDEVQKVPGWSETVKGLWDRQMQTHDSARIHLLLLGSAPLLMQKGLTESLAGRYELLHMPHWSFEEMNDAFDCSLEQYLYFGAYPGSAGLIHNEPRWRGYVIDGLIQPNIEKDILMLARVDKPALLRQLFETACAYSGQIVSLDKTLGQLSDAGNVTTLARYLDLLNHAGLVCGLRKYSGQALRQRQAPPKFQVLNNALMGALGAHSFAEARADRSHWGRLTESAVGAHLVNTAGHETRIHYWREGPREVDFVIQHRGRLAAVEVKSGKTTGPQPGMAEFASRNPGCRSWVVGPGAVEVEEFLRFPASHWAE